MRKPELLVPASSLEVLKVAVIFGADAVYIGGEVFGLRAKAKNFSMEDMKDWKAKCGDSKKRIVGPVKSKFSGTAFPAVRYQKLWIM